MALFRMVVLCKSNGQGMVEYALVLAMVVVLATAFLAGTGDVKEAIEMIFRNLVGEF